MDVLADKFFHVRDKHSDLRQRAVSLKETCKELGTQHKFSFIVLDCVARRVFLRGDGTLGAFKFWPRDGWNVGRFLLEDRE